ncbi:MAG: peptidoglycan DD-metalloendopeptidase family protein [Eubacteriales bacterium]|nr:peptidoglycan DD-metalloendopeptidase family protein [Eubacteriales bacterium]
MKKHRTIKSATACFLLAVITAAPLLCLLPGRAYAASSSEIQKQIDALKKEKEEISAQIQEVQNQFKENEDEIQNILEQKNVIDQQVQLLTTQITNITDQISAYNILIADKQEELDTAEDRYAQLSEDNKVRVRAMEEDGEVSYWEVVFKANSFSDLLDRLSMVEEIAASDQRRIQELSDAKNAVGAAQDVLAEEKSALESTKSELDQTEQELDAKQAEAVALLQELLEKADDLEELEQDFEEQEAQFLEEIAQKEQEYSEAKQREWEAYMATYTPPTTAPSNEGASSTGTTAASSSWLVPCSYTSITSPFGYRTSPTAGASTYHQGVDLDTGTGWPVVASRAGIVAIAGWSNSAGNYVQIDHQDGFRSIYMHLSSIGVSTGQIVSAGQYIGATGSTGVSTGDHLHFGISLNGVYVNPCSYVNL